MTSERIVALELALALCHKELTTSKRLIIQIGKYSQEIVEDAMAHQLTHDRRPVRKHRLLVGRMETNNHD